MRKYLELFKDGFDATIAEKTKVKNWPYVGYSPSEGVVFTVIPEPVVEQPDNEIWYTSSDGNVVTPYSANVFDANIVSNTYEDGKGVITFDGGVTFIGRWAFRGCSSLTSIVIPNSVTRVGGGIFYGCSNLESVVLSNNITSLPVEAYGKPTRGFFEGCSSLTSIVIPDSVTSIGPTAFSDCKSLTSIVIPDSVTSIEEGAFMGCSELTSVTIPNSVTSIEYKAFEGTGMYNDNLNWENDVFYIDNCLILAKESITGTYTIKENTRLIANSAFSHCSSLTSITIPNSVTSIGRQVFVVCPSLTSITFEGTMEEWNNINKGDYWNYQVPATYVQCSDGQVTL